MLRNNNQQIITHLAGCSLKNNRRRTMILVFAILLSSFMLFSVLTVGVTYFKMQRIQNIRVGGGEYDAFMYGVTAKQQKLCEDNPDITATGIAAISGYAIETKADSTPNVGLIWADDTYWNEMMEPAREWVKGEYPKAENEVMVTKSALKECGLEELGVGDSFTLMYGTALGEYTKQFKISGMWDGYGTKKVFYMSEAFYEQSGNKLSSVSSGRYYIDFKQSIISEKTQNEFIDSMNLGKQQALLFVADFGHSVEILAGVIGLILVTCFCAYLLIYNIMYLSVSGNIRYYGLLQTVGMTSRQVRGLVRKQVLLVGGIGIMVGILVGCGVSVFVIPKIIKIMGIQSGEIQIVFHPFILLLTLMITGITIYWGSRKAVRLASSISPIEATGYRPHSGHKTTRKTGRGKLMWRMAKEQLTKDKKKSAIVILSLAASMSVFLCIVTLLESQGARTVISNFMNLDMVVKNDTLTKRDRDDWVQILDADFISELEDHQGIKEVNPIWNVEITVPWEPKFTDLWMSKFYEKWMTIPYQDDIQEYKEHPENFGSFLVGINERDFEYLNSTLTEPIDKERFLAGETCVLYRNNLEFETADLAGEQVTCVEYADQTNSRSFEITALTDEYYYTGALLGYAPTIIVSDTVVAEFTDNAKVSKAGLLYHEEYSRETEADVLAAVQASPYVKDFSYESKIEEMETLKSAQGNMMEIGVGIALILALIGIMNYMNTVIGNIQSRKVELAIMESVGMTGKQVNQMLMIEGSIFAGCALLLSATVGLGITYIIYQMMNYQGIPFAVPVFPIVGMVLFIVVICVVIPLWARHMIVRKDSIIERIRRFE